METFLTIEYTSRGGKCGKESVPAICAAAWYRFFCHQLHVRNYDDPVSR